MNVRYDDYRVIQTAAEIANVPPTRFIVETQDGWILINHPDSMKWSSEVHEAIRDAVKKLTGMNAAVT